MSSHTNSPFGQIAGCIELIRARESSQGAYFGDGPTAGKIDELANALAAAAGPPDTIEVKTIWSAYRALIETEFSWLFPERDPISSEMIPALQTVRQVMEDTLVASDSAWKDRLEELANLHVIRRAAERQTKLRGNKIDLGIVAARFLNKIGLKGTAESIAEKAIRRWEK